MTTGPGPLLMNEKGQFRKRGSFTSQGPYLNSKRDEGAGRAPNTVPSIQRRVTVSYLAVKQRETSHSYNQGLSWWSQIGHLDIPGVSGGYIQFRYLGKWQQRCQII